MNNQENCNTAYNSAQKAFKSTIEIIKSRNICLSSARVAVIQKDVGISTAPPNLAGFCGFAERVLGWIPLNPNDIERVRALISIYYIPGFDQDTFSEISLECPHPISNSYGQGQENIIVNKLPSKEGLQAIFNIITSAPNRLADRLTIIEGKRGSGKTMTLNFFLTTAHKKLSTKGVIWFRTDIARLWNYREIPLTLKSYTILHAIYVALKHSNEDPNLKVFSDKGCGFTSYLSKISGGSGLLQLWNEIAKSFNDACRVTRLAHDPKPLDQFLFRCNHLLKDRDSIFYLGTLFEEFICYLRIFAKKNELNLIVLIIMDGFDNIRVGAHHDRYHSFLKEANQVLNEPPINIVDKFILIARPETIEDFNFVRTGMQNGILVPRKFEMESLFINKILLKKSESIENPVKFFQHIAQNFVGNSFVDNGQCFDFKTSIDFLVKEFEKSNTIFDQEKPIDVIFDGNIRSLLRNCIRAHHHKKFLDNTYYGQT